MTCYASLLVWIWIDLVTTSHLTNANKFDEYFVEHRCTIQNNVPVSSSNFHYNVSMNPITMVMHGTYEMYPW